MICYGCNKPGHYRPDCPEHKSSLPAEKTEDAAKKIKHKSIKALAVDLDTVEQHSTAGSEDSDSDSEDAQQSTSGPLKNNEMLGQMNNQEMPITLDTGADVSMVPEELVEECQYTSQSVMVRCASRH